MRQSSPGRPPERSARCVRRHVPRCGWVEAPLTCPPTACTHSSDSCLRRLHPSPAACTPALQPYTPNLQPHVPSLHGAQRCYYEKLLAERSPSQQALSCLAAAAAHLYAEAADAIEHAHGAPFTRLGGGEWAAAVAVHASLYGALARLHAAAAHAARGEHGKRLGQLARAQEEAAAAALGAARLPRGAAAHVLAAQQLVQEAHAQARHENETVYFDAVPPWDALPPCTATCLVKPLLPPELM
eukprot:scaffold16698_cov56-Phaeocystis_antarctica.AAC.3